jgi:F0F1-type ATP synthase assembly protein I
MVLLGLGTMNALCLVVGLGGGWLLDRHLGSTPLFTLVGLGLGIAAGGVATWREIRGFLRD